MTATDQTPLSVLASQVAFCAARQYLKQRTEIDTSIATAQERIILYKTEQHVQRLVEAAISPPCRQLSRDRF